MIRNASVCRNGFSPTFAIITPLTRPTSAPTSKTIPNPSQGLVVTDQQLGQVPRSIPVNIAENPAIEPMERSKCPDRRQRLSANTSSPIGTAPHRIN
jgi:hypothetical protein